MKLTKALDKNEILQSVAFRLYENSIDSEGTIPFTQFLMSSPSIQTLILSGNGSAEYDHATTIVIEALSHSKSLSSLDLENVAIKRPEVLEGLLASTPSLITELTFIASDDSGSTMENAQALRRGLERN